MSEGHYRFSKGSQLLFHNQADFRGPNLQPRQKIAIPPNKVTGFIKGSCKLRGYIRSSHIMFIRI